MTSGRRRGEFAEGAVIIGVSAFFYALTWNFSDPRLTMESVPSPAAFPRLILAIIMILGLLRVVSAMRVSPTETMEVPWDAVVLVTMVLSVAYAIASYFLGVLIPMPVYCLALAWLWGGRDKVKLTAMAVGLPLFVWVFFVLLFRARLPLGPELLQ